MNSKSDSHDITSNCPVCNKLLVITLDGHYRKHTFKNNICKGSKSKFDPLLHTYSINGNLQTDKSDVFTMGAVAKVALAEENLNNLFASNQSLFTSLTAPTNPILVSANLNNPEFLTGSGPQELISILEQSIVSQNRTNGLICSYLTDLVNTMSKFDGIKNTKKNKKRKHYVLDSTVHGNNQDNVGNGESL